MAIKKLLLAASVLVVTVTSNTAFAEDRTPGSGPNPFSDCGIGAALFSETKWAAVISNVIWDIGITAVTSAVASPQTCSGKKVETAMFIGKTYASLTEETATGEGQHLTTVLQMFGCGAEQQNLAISQMRNEMGKAVAEPGYASQSPVKKAATFYNVTESAAKAHCSA